MICKSEQILQAFCRMQKLLIGCVASISMKDLFITWEIAYKSEFVKSVFLVSSCALLLRPQAFRYNALKANIKSFSYVFNLMSSNPFHF